MSKYTYRHDCDMLFYALGGLYQSFNHKMPKSIDVKYRELLEALAREIQDGYSVCIANMSVFFTSPPIELTTK